MKWGEWPRHSYSNFFSEGFRFVVEHLSSHGKIKMVRAILSVPVLDVGREYQTLQKCERNKVGLSCAKLRQVLFSCVALQLG